jgi:hypothetical protein
MFENRISELFQMTVNFEVVDGNQPVPPAAATAAQLLPLISTEGLYQMAAARARYDHELDKLFNPEYYGDHGSGI